MAKAAALFLARSVLELALAFLVLGGLLAYLSFRIVRRFVSIDPDGLERTAARGLQALELVASVAAKAAAARTSGT